MRTEPFKKLFTAELQQLKKRGREVSPASAQALSSSQPQPLPSQASSSDDKNDICKEISDLREDIRLLARVIAPDVDFEEIRRHERAEGEVRLEKRLTVNEEEYIHLLSDFNMLKTELKLFSSSIDKTKREIAALHPPQPGDDRLVAVAFELDAIVSSTEGATHTILAAAERIDGLAENIKVQTKDFNLPQLLQLADEISEAVVSIYEACNFQDITGQRITKVVDILKYVEDRVNAMVNIWGEDSFAHIAVFADERSEDEKLLNGPQLENEGISQAEIDQLFG